MCKKANFLLCIKIHWLEASFSTPTAINAAFKLKPQAAALLDGAAAGAGGDGNQAPRQEQVRNGTIKPLISLLSSSDLQLQEYGVTVILNFSLCDENKELIASSGVIKPLVRSLKTGTATTKENTACALLRLSQIEEDKDAIGRSGVIPLLVNLLECGGFRGKNDASTTLYSLCSVKENNIRAVESGIMKPLVELMADFGSNMVDKSTYVLSVLVSVPEARATLVKEAEIPVLVEIVKVGSQRQNEISVVILLKLCENSGVHRNMVVCNDANRAKQKAETLTKLLRQPRSGNGAARPSDVSL
ncbi:hypothetical protein ACFX13_047123 [Malus domestica]|nr:U-box domain-containing protein 4-like [Malus domestica]